MASQIDEMAGVPRGYVDYVGVERIAGWAGTSRGQALWVHVYDGSRFLVSTTSNSIRRDDAAPLCGGNPWVGFSVALPRLSPGSHTIRVYVSPSRTPSRTTRLGGASKLRVPSAEFIGPSPFGVVESIAPGRVSGWACDPDSRGAPLRLQVLIQYDCRGDFVVLAEGATGITRQIPFCGPNARPGFEIALPPIHGGRHHIIVKGLNVGSGRDRLLEKFGDLWFTAFPYLPTVNADPDFLHAPGCWTTDPGPGESYDVSGCPGWSANTPLWAMFLGRGPNTAAPLPKPQPGYPGAAAYVRYARSRDGGMVFAINNALAPWPWWVNAQGMRTIMPEIPLSQKSKVVLESTLTVEPGSVYLGGDHPELGGPWIHVFVTAVFYDAIAGKTYFIEVVPYCRDRVGGATAGFIGQPDGDPNARLIIDDPRLAPHVSIPTAMLTGEQRRLWIDLKPAFQSVFSGLTAERVTFTGAYVGTEQLGPGGITLKLSRLAVYAY